ncbi:hypothetical protein GGI11_004766, partial [Coemansia sp. RSA 2049]
SGRKHVYLVDNEKFDKSTVPMRKWSEYELDLLDEPKSQYAASETGSRFSGAAAIPHRPGSATGNIPKSMVGYAASNYGTNSVYYDNGYGYSTMINNNITANGAGVHGGTFDHMNSGSMTPNAYEMTTLGTPMGVSGVTQAQMPMPSAHMDPRLSQASAGGFFSQQGVSIPDQRFSAAYSPMPGVQPYAMAPYNSSQGPVSGGNDQSAAMLGQLDVGPSVLADFISPPGSPAGIQGQHQNHQQHWPSGVTDEQIAIRVSEIISTTDLMSITKKQVRQQIMANFGMPVDEEKSRRDFINQCIAQELEKRQQGI